MFIPDPGYRVDKIPDLGSGIASSLCIFSHHGSKKYGVGIRDPRSGIRIPCNTEKYPGNNSEQLYFAFQLFVENIAANSPRIVQGADDKLVHRHFISVCYVSATKRIGIKRIAAFPIGLKRIGN